MTRHKNPNRITVASAAHMRKRQPISSSNPNTISTNGNVCATKADPAADHGRLSGGGKNHPVELVTGEAAQNGRHAVVARDGVKAQRKARRPEPRDGHPAAPQVGQAGCSPARPLPLPKSRLLHPPSMERLSPIREAGFVSSLHRKQSSRSALLPKALRASSENSIQPLKTQRNCVSCSRRLQSPNG